ncbi:hypothetical protein [Streptacidiphilus jiangxiensis]|uniref:Uncharacterized protein n=1 Tax=Streptacidiphilus jiangxiensis TaxID=235985 RepID=A0A1H7I6K4_STRJI|nr:hypothetical protein [Streptacidiphilus jiangxiensis]SEK58169.1 hypothetical protein SAMN05414137_102525 [Streptacidiphilus jiangxiensis]
MISGMAAMGPDHGQLVPIRLIGGPSDGRTILHVHPPGTPLPDVIHYGPGADAGAYRHHPDHPAGHPEPAYVWEPGADTAP